MAGFTINGTEFGIDLGQSRCALARRLFRGPALTVEIHGDSTVFETLKQVEGSAWSWALYPPSFSLRALPVPKSKGGQIVEVRLTPSEVERHEVGLYMMEHNPVSDVILRLGPGTEVVICGKVELIGEPGEFRIEWTC
jgi:hypothetical protein